MVKNLTSFASLIEQSSFIFLSTRIRPSSKTKNVILLESLNKCRYVLVISINTRRVGESKSIFLLFCNCSYLNGINTYSGIKYTVILHNLLLQFAHDSNGHHV